MSLVLKMRVRAATRYDGGGVEYDLNPVYGPGNEQWSKYTPSGNLKFTVTNPDAPALEVGGEYLVTLAPAQSDA